VPLKRNDFFPRLAELSGKLGQTHLPTIFLGLGLLVILLGLRRLTPKLPVALVACIVAIVASKGLSLEDKGVSVVGSFPQGLPGFALPNVGWHEIQALLPTAIGIALLTYTEGILLARAFAAKNGYEVNANQELNALGAADIATSLFQGFSITGSQARTTINDSAGGKTQVASLVAGLALAVFLIFLTRLLAPLPEVALAVILVYAGFGLVEFGVMVRIYRFYPKSAIVAGLTTLSVLLAGVVPGIVFGVALSLLGLINRISHPPDTILTAVPGDGFHDLGIPVQGQTLPGLIAYRFYAPLLFSNVNHFVDRVRELIVHSSSPVSWLLLDAQAISDIDVTAVEALHSLREELARRGIALKIAHANPPLRQLLERTGLAGEIGHQSFFGSVHECIEVFKNQSRSTPP